MSVYEHSLAVARMCLRIAKYFPGEVDMRSLVRGALLHDYFLYDWHIPDESHKWYQQTTERNVPGCSRAGNEEHERHW